MLRLESRRDLTLADGSVVDGIVHPHERDAGALDAGGPSGEDHVDPSTVIPDVADVERHGLAVDHEPGRRAGVVRDRLLVTREVDLDDVLELVGDDLAVLPLRLPLPKRLDDLHPIHQQVAEEHDERDAIEAVGTEDLISAVAASGAEGRFVPGSHPLRVAVFVLLVRQFAADDSLLHVAERLDERIRLLDGVVEEVQDDEMFAGHAGLLLSMVLRSVLRRNCPTKRGLSQVLNKLR